MKHWFVLGLAFCAIAGCESGSDADGAQRHGNWRCFEHDDVCSCDALRDGWEGGGVNQVDRCESYNCCLFSEVGTESTTASCECVNSDNCDAEAATRTATRVVDECPPRATQAPVACAESGVNCRGTYLANRGLEGCCDGTLCKENQEGVPVCTPASEEEITADRACRRGLSLTRDEPLEVLDPLVTTTGELMFDTTTEPMVRIGEGGCVQSIAFALRHAEHPSCTLSLVAGPQRDPQGNLQITSAFITDDCSSVPPLADGLIRPTSVTGTLAFEGVRCGSSTVGIESHCLAGAFELRLQAEVVELPTTVKTVFTGNAVRLQGVGCGMVSFDKSCPAGS